MKWNMGERPDGQAEALFPLPASPHHPRHTMLLHTLLHMLLQVLRYMLHMAYIMHAILHMQHILHIMPQHLLHMLEHVAMQDSVSEA